MADISFETQPQQEEIQQPVIDSIPQGSQEEVTPIVTEDIVHDNGLTMEEINDANKIHVTVADALTPLVILFGPPSCGKTMTLVRLTRFLKNNGYTVVPETSFRPGYDKNFKEMCEHFNEMINSDDAANSTSKINFMLVKVLKNGRPLCQILEGPGEYYFNPGDPKAPFPAYVNSIIASDNRKIWAIIVEPDNTNKRMDMMSRRNYVDKVHRLKTQINPRDKVLFVYNKIDETHFVVSPGVIRYGLALQDVKNMYPGLFEPFTNVNPITKLWKPYNFDFVAFQTGYFSQTTEGSLTFQEGHNIYPKKLWEFIMKRIRG